MTSLLWDAFVVSRQIMQCLYDNTPVEFALILTLVILIISMIFTMLHLGPNVFVDSTGVDGNNDTGPHERWAMGVLYDNITCNTINVRQRSWMGSGQGWAGKQSPPKSVLHHFT